MFNSTRLTLELTVILCNNSGNWNGYLGFFIMGIKLMGSILPYLPNSKAEENCGGLLQKNNRHASAVSFIGNSKTHNSVPIVALKLNTGRETLAKSPIGWNNVFKKFGDTVGCRDSERQRLTIQIRIGLPISSPISWHSHPPSFWAFDGHRSNRTSSSDIVDQHKLEVISPIHTEPNPSLLHARNPASNTSKCYENKSVGSFEKRSLNNELSWNLWNKTGTIPPL